MRLSISLLALFFLSFGTVAAQQLCPTDVILALGRSGSACVQMERNQACYGNGTVAATFYSAVPPAFALPGAIVDARQIEQITVRPTDAGLSAASLLVQSTLTALEARSLALFAYGDATVTNRYPPLPELLVEATGTLNIRATPQGDGDIIQQLSVGETLIANGRYAEDASWLRVRLPLSEALGWVSTQASQPVGDVMQLLAVDVDTPFNQPYEAITIETGDVVFCDGALPSGVLLQSSARDEGLSLALNGATVTIAGSAFVQAAGADLAFFVLDGWVRLGSEAYAPAGTLIRAEAGTVQSPEPYVDVAALPVNNLPNRVTIAEPLAADQIEAAILDIHAEAEVVTVQATRAPQRAVCRRIVTRRTTTWAGPGEFYEALSELADSSAVFPMLQYIGEDEIWWQLRTSAWIRASRVYEEGDCGDILIIEEVPPQPYNIFSMERCESLNGPLRVGQAVTIEFNPPAYEGLAEAQQATRIDPGRIMVNQRSLHVAATAPIRLGGEADRYVRTFYAYWTAQGGTFRIASDRLSYELVCEVTVPFG